MNLTTENNRKETMNLTTENNRKETMNLITEAVLDEAIEAAEAGHINGLTYDQSSWCGTACCVLGFARHIAGLPEQYIGPQDSEFSESPKISTLRKLMGCSSPDILRVMKSVTEDGKINLKNAEISYVDLNGNEWLKLQLKLQDTGLDLDTIL